jgi:glucose/arabinose dehydrogenase
MRQLILGAALALLLLGTFGVAPAQSAESDARYVPSGMCDGFPNIQLRVQQGMCIGLVAEHLGFARGVAIVAGNVYVTDMGGWRPKHGRLLRLGHDGHDAPVVVLDHLDEPNTVAVAPGGTLYIGLLGRIVQLDPVAADPSSSMKDVVINLPSTGRHPLASFVVASDGSLYVNIGAATDHCEHPDGSQPDPSLPCPESVATPARAALIHVSTKKLPVDATTLKPLASGLRNTMALAVLPSGQLVGATNARDFINLADPKLSDNELPHDTYERIDAGADYGWPYCFDMNLASPEFPAFRCATKHAPTLLLPAHAAPLGMLFYRGSKLPALNGKLIIPYHGYRDTGHRIVMLKVDDTGQPQGVPQVFVDEWDNHPGRNPQGCPVSVFEANDGSIFIAEDHNGTLLRLSRAQQ